MSENPNGPRPNEVSKTAVYIVQWTLGIGAVLAALHFLGALDYLTGKASRREKALALCSNFRQQHNEISEYWELMNKATDNTQRRVCLDSCQSAIEAINPYDPAGVDPPLSEAVAEYKRAAQEVIRFAYGQLASNHPDQAKLDALMDRVTAAQDKVCAVFNKIAAEVGGLEWRRDPNVPDD
jgi:hypothetical protein